MPEDVQIADYALDGRTRIIEVEGQVDIYSAPEFKSAPRALSAKAPLA
jgi:hypothetical protein